MRTLIDTNIAVFLTDRREEVRRRIAELEEPPVISLVTLAELEGGVRKDAAREAARRAQLDALLAWVEVLPFDRSSVDAYGAIVAKIGFSRSRLLDRLIAATAIVYDLKLITTNGSDFVNIPNLKLEIWPRPVQ